jgi:hypothetical protein
MRRSIIAVLVCFAAALVAAPAASAASNITVVPGTTLTNNAGPPTFAPTGAGSQVGADLINAQLTANTNVTLDTTSAAGDPGTITVSAPISSTGTGDLILDADSGVSFGSTVSVETLSVTAGDPISQTAAATVTGIASFTTNTSDGVTLTNSGNNFTTVTTGLVGGLSVTDANALNLGAISANSAFNLNSGGPISQTGAVITTALVITAGSANDVTLNNASNSIPSLRVNSADSVSVTNSGATSLNGPSVVSGDFTLSSNGAITQNAQLWTVTGATTLTASAAGDVLLPNSGNDWGSVGVPQGTNAVIMDVNDLTLNDSSVAGNISIRAGDDLAVSAGDTLASVGAITLIADNQNATPPAIGTGGIAAGANSALTGAGAIRLYGATRADNSIAANATFNGSTFTPGPIFIPSAREQWGIYASGGTATAPFTFFYKDNGTPTPDPTPTPTPTPITAGKDPKCKKLGSKLGTQKRRVRKLRGRAKQVYIENNIKDTRKRQKKLSC